MPSDNIAITAGSGTTIATDDVSSVHYQRVKLVDGTLDSSAAIAGDVTNGLDVDVTRVPADPFGANADAASATGSISAKLRFIAATGIPVTSVASHAVTNAGTFAVQDSEKIADDAAFTPATSKVSPSGFMLDDSSTDLVDEGDCGVARMTPERKQIFVIGESGPNLIKGGGSQTGTSDQSIMAASGSASISNYLSWVSVYNSSATNTYINIKDGSTVVAVIPAPAYGGAIVNLTVPIRGTANTAFNAAAGAGVTTMYMYGGGYRGA